MQDDKRHLLVGVLGVALALGCTTAPNDHAGGSVTDEQTLAVAMGAVARSPGTHSCELGGTITLDRNSQLGEPAGDRRVLTVDSHVSLDGCRQHLSGPDVELTVDGWLTASDTVTYTWDGTAVGTPLSQVGRQRGRMRTRADGSDETCDFDLRQTYDQGGGRLHLVGTICGRHVEMEVTVPAHSVAAGVRD